MADELILIRGDDRTLDVAVTDPDTGDAVDLTGAQALTFTIKRASADTSIVLQKTLGSGVQITDALEGEAIISLTAANTAGLSGEYAWDLEYRDSAAKTTTVGIGRLMVVYDVTDLSPAGSLLTVDQVRDRVNTSLSDTAVAQLINEATVEIAGRVGAYGATTEYLDGETHLLILSRPVLTIASITETNRSATTITLAANDYVLRSPYVLERIDTGTNPAVYWDYRVTVTYTPTDDLAIRQGVAIDLIRLSLARNPGITSQSIGDFSESYAASEDYDAERDTILCRLDTAAKVRII